MKLQQISLSGQCSRQVSAEELCSRKRENDRLSTRGASIYALLFSCSVFLGSPTAVMAQDDADESGEIEEIVVHGIRYSQELAIGVKRNAIGVVDAISADDMGRLPDKNAAESVDRLPGVSVTTDQGEGRYVVIRGVSASLNNLTINGVSAGSPESDGGGRAAPLDVVGGDMLNGIEVIKTPTSDMDGQGIGGTVNVKTPSPFDKEERMFGSFSTTIGSDDFSDNTPWSANGTFAIKNSSDTVGLLVSATYSYRDYVARGIFQDDWRDIDGESSDGSTTTDWIPERTKNNNYELERKRTGLSANLEFRPTDSSKYYVRAYYSLFEEDELRLRYEHFFTRDPFDIDGLTGSSVGNRREQDLREEQKDKQFANFSLGGENVVGNDWTIDYGVQFNTNEQEEPNRKWEFRGNGYEDSWDIDSRGIAAITSTGQDPQDPSFLTFLRFRSQDNRTTEDAAIAFLNFQKDIEFGSKPGFVKFGAKYGATERDNDASQIRYNLGDTDWTMADFDHAGPAFSNEVDGYLMPNLGFNWAAANDFYDNNVNNTDYFEFDEEDTFVNDFDSDYLIDETVIAGYLMASVDLSDTTNVTFGVRVEQTDVDSSGFRRDEDNLTAELLTETADYTNVLPSLIFRWNATDNLVVRAAYTTAIGRPGFNQIANTSEFFSEDILGESFGAISVGNPALEPHESVNLDLSVEYYTESGGLLSGALFYKDIDNFIFGYSDQCDSINGDDPTCEFEGITYDVFTFSSVENAESASITGFEVNYQQPLTFLPGLWSGLGIGISGTIIESEMQIRGRDFEQSLLEQPDWITSFMVYYQTERFEATLAIDDSDRYLDGISGDDGTEDSYKDGYGRLDFKASYDFSDNYTVFVEWQNINDEPLIEFQSDVRNRNTQIETYGQTYTLGVSARF